MTSHARAPRAATRAAERIAELCAAGLPAQQLIEGVAERIRDAIPMDGMFLAATDPETMLALGPGVVHEMPDTVCEPFWAFEFEVPDYNKFTDLAQGSRQVADLHAATGGRPERSARYREMRTLMDADAELRATFNAGGRAWGLLHAHRAGGTDGFSVDEVAFLERVAPGIGRALRVALVSQPADGLQGRGPGMAVIDAGNRVLSATPEAVAWFDEIDSIKRLPGSRMGVDLPSEVLNTAQVARANGGATRTRVRTKSGAWLLIHASCLRAPDGTLGSTALVVEPAKASEVAPLIVEAYELTAREVDVTRGLARGLTTNEIAHELHLSRYTVADHLKSVYEKVGVSSRAELVAKMFADHYHDRVRDAVHAAAVAA
jgi:DNA-binding CsgD family transcriptional regulator